MTVFIQIWWTVWPKCYPFVLHIQYYWFLALNHLPYVNIIYLLKRMKVFKFELHSLLLILTGRLHKIWNCYSFVETGNNKIWLISIIKILRFSKIKLQSLPEIKKEFNFNSLIPLLSQWLLWKQISNCFKMDQRWNHSVFFDNVKFNDNVYYHHQNLRNSQTAQTEIIIRLQIWQRRLFLIHTNVRMPQFLANAGLPL